MRIFKFRGQLLPDPGEGFTPEMVRELYAGQYPDLANAQVVEREEEGVKVVRPGPGNGAANPLAGAKQNPPGPQPQGAGGGG